MATLTKRSTKLAWLALGIAALAAVMLLLDRAQRPVIMDVAGRATVSMDVKPRDAVQMTVDSMGFPRTAGPGFRVLGGTTFEIDGRGAAAVTYVRGEERITYALVSGTDHINDVMGHAVQIGEPKRELVWVAPDVVHFKRNGRNAVIVATPASERLRRLVNRLSGASQ